MGKNIFRTEYHPKKSKWHILENVMFIVILMIFIKIMLFNFLYMSATVDGESMQPNLNATYSLSDNNREEDIVFVSKYATFNRGDIVVVKGAKPLIKRVIATEGDTLKYQQNLETNEYQLYLNGELLSEDYGVVTLTCENIDLSPHYNQQIGPFGYLKTLAAEKQNCLDTDGDGIFETYKVPKGKVFVLGDNRPNSLDSRIYGSFFLEDIQGTVVKVLPHNTSKLSLFLNILLI